jgi:glycosyltransferase involved in cell wall biosynthesis
MKILLMADTPMNPHSGAAGTEYQTVMGLRAIGHEVTSIWSDQLPHGIRHGNLHYLLELPWAYRQRVRDHLRSRHFDVVHISQPHGYLAARFIGRQPGDRPVFVHRSHGLEMRVRATLFPWTRRLAAPRPLLRKMASSLMDNALEINNRGITRHADGHIVSSSLCADFLQREYAVPRSRIALIAQAPPDAFLASPCLPFNPQRLDKLLYVGQYAFIKAPMILAQAFAAILAQRPGSTLTWVCDARDHGKVAALFSAEQRQRVTLLAWVAQEQLQEIYDEHGIFLFPSFFEGFGKAFLEAMARGLVVVASAEGGARDLIENGRNGLLVPVGDATAMAQACLSIQSGQPNAQTLSVQARQTASAHTWARVARETADFYRRLMDQR